MQSGCPRTAANLGRCARIGYEHIAHAFGAKRNILRVELSRLRFDKTKLKPRIFANAVYFAGGDAVVASEGIQHAVKRVYEQIGVRCYGGGQCGVRRQYHGLDAGRGCTVKHIAGNARSDCKKHFLSSG